MILKIISKKHGEFNVLIDDEDAPIVIKHTWAIQKIKTFYYAVCSEIKNGRRKRIYMHRLISGASGDEFVDHINHNTVDNRKSNIRKCTRAQNVQNSKKPITGKKSKYKGLCRVERDGKIIGYQVRIRVNGERKYAGFSKDEKVAAKLYNEAAVKYHKEYAYVNIIN